MSAVNIKFPGNLAQVRTAQELRRVDSDMFTDGMLFIVTALASVFAFDTGSLALDNGTTVIRPNDRGLLQAGRWLYTAEGLAPGPPGPQGPEQSFLAKLPDARREEVFAGTLPASFDATGYLQEALDEYAGQAIIMPRGRIYIRKAMFVASGTSLQMANSRLVANYADWIDSGIADFLYGQPGIDTDKGFFFVNKGYQSDTLSDTDIKVFGGQYIRGVGEKSGHAIFMRRAKRVIVDGIHAEYGGNATAMLACEDTTVVNSSAYNTYNAGFDHWDGTGFAKVSNVAVICDHGDTQQGVQFTGQPTNPATGADTAIISGSNIQCKGIRNTAGGQASAFIVNALNNASSVKTGNFSSIVIDGCDNGIVLQGDVRGMRIDAVVKNAANQPVTLTVNSVSETEAPSGNLVDVTLVDCAAQYALVGVIGSNNVVHVKTAGTNSAVVSVQFYEQSSLNRVYGEDGFTAADISTAKTNQLLTSTVRSYTDAGQTVLTPAQVGGAHDMVITSIGAGARAEVRGAVVALSASTGEIGLTANGVNVGFITQFGLSLLAGKSLAINNEVVIAGKVTGYGTPVGAARLANFDANTATTLTTAQLLAALIVDLKAGTLPKA